MENDQFCISNIPLVINPKGILTPPEEMSYFYLYFRQRSIKNSDVLKSLATYFQDFKNFLKIIIFLEDVINDFPKVDKITNGDLRIFLQQKCVKSLDFDEFFKVEMKKSTER